MLENFETTNKDLDKDSFNTTFVNSNLPGADYETHWIDDRYNWWEDDGVSLTGNPYNFSNFLQSNNFSKKTETLSFISSPSPGNDHITFNSSPVFNLKMPEKNTNNNGFWKYEEDKTLKEVEQYLSSTYHSHYTSETSKTQTLDLIESIGDAEAFTRSNAIKYLSRFGKKNGKSKQDILKAIHYCILLYHFAGLHKKTTSDFPY
jgi:hypothetical protein